MDYRWTSHLETKDDKDRFLNHIRNSRSVLERQHTILSQWEEELTSKEVSESSYDSPSWAALQADRNGYRRALRKIKALITLDQKENQ